jgi:hypothetical protein
MPSHNGQCPNCKTTISHVQLEGISVKAKGGNWNGVSYLCPSCNCVLSVGIDPVALKTDLVREILENLRRG